jgi:uncharacterized RDD family membrane protein YckC
MMPRTLMGFGVVALVMALAQGVAALATGNTLAGGVASVGLFIAGALVMGSLIVSPARRVGFLGRDMAFLIDLLLVHWLVAAIGLGAIELTGSRVRVANAIDDVRTCSAWEAIPPGLSVPGEFAGGDMRRCTRSVYGFDYDRMLVVREAASPAIDDSERKQITIAIDADGRPVHAFYLDSLTPLVLALYLLLLEWRFGATLGKLALGIRVVTLGGGSIGFLQAGKRALVRALVLLCSAETQIRLGMTTAYGLPDLGLWSRMLNWLALAYVIAFAIALLGGFRAPHDIWAGTQVVTREGRQNEKSENAVSL